MEVGLVIGSNDTSVAKILAVHALRKLSSTFVTTMLTLRIGLRNHKRRIWSVSVLSSLPIYHLSLFRMPQKVCVILERIQRQFLLGGSAPEKKIPLVSWATVCSEKNKCGIGVKSFSKMNKALLSKWSWRFANDINALWRKTICCKFGESIGCWHTRDIRGSYGTSLWKEISKE